MNFIAAEQDATLRLDQHLASQLPERSRSEIQRWIKEGRVRVDGVIARSSLRLAPGMAIEVDAPEAPAATSTVQAEDVAIPIVYEDGDLLVIDKPAGLVVHPAPGHEAGTLVNAVLHHDPTIEGVGGEKRPGIVHRLDKETSGLIVVAKNDRAHRALQAQFKSRTVEKEYLALVEGRVDPPAGLINVPIGRHPQDRKRQAVFIDAPSAERARARDALTEYHTVATYHSKAGGMRTTYSLLRILLHTGRTHQIRVHLAWRKHPVVGDMVYGFRTVRLPLKRTFLHAHRLRLVLPSTGEEREFIAPLPSDLQAILDMLTRD
jgi:23S rRNA pseudouridine1911/1915/1917 synthase